MQKFIWSACLLSAVLLGPTTKFVKPADSILAEQAAAATVSTALVGQGVMDELSVAVQPVDAKLDVRPLLGVIAGVPGFADWQGAEAQAVRHLHDREARTNAVLWRVKGGEQAVGYLVTSPDGQAVYEFSRRPVPELPAHLRGQGVDNGYLYGGPTLQLAYVNGAQGAELVQLLTGEMLPSGELLNRVPDDVPAMKTARGPAMEKTEASAQVLSLPASPHAEDDAVYATGLYGQSKLGQPDTGVLPLQEFAKQEAYPRPAMVVYDAIPDKFYIALTLSQTIRLGGETAFLAVNDPFAMTPEQKLPIYINSQFPVCAVPVNQ
jgi:hypothetical protein